MFAMAGPLPNRKHEIASIEWATGAPLLDGYLAAGYKPGYSARFNASRLRNKAHIRSRMEELFQEAAKDAIVSIGWVQRKLIEVATGREPTKIRTDSDGKTVEERDRLAALVALAKTLGVHDVNISATAIAGAAAEPEHLSDIDVARRMAFLLAQAAGGEEVRPYQHNIESGIVGPIYNGTDIVDNAGVSVTSVQHESTARQKPNDINGGNEPATMFFNDVPCPPAEAATAAPAQPQPADQVRQFSLNLEKQAERPEVITFAPLPGAAK